VDDAPDIDADDEAQSATARRPAGRRASARGIVAGDMELAEAVFRSAGVDTEPESRVTSNLTGSTCCWCRTEGARPWCHQPAVTVSMSASSPTVFS